MGVNLIPKVERFHIRTHDFAVDNESVKHGCITPGKHRIMFFDIELHNIGNADFVIGRPENHPDVFMPDPSGINQVIFREKFYTWKLTDEAGVEKKTGFKVAFCIMDFTKRDVFNCDHQGVGVGGHDLYSQMLPCQFVEIDDLQNGTYWLHVTANAHSVQQVKSGQIPLFEEDDYDDNTASIHLPIIDEIDPVPIKDEDFVNVASTNDIQPSQMKAVLLGDETVCIANVTGNFFAFGDVCTHMGCSLAEGTLSNTEVKCLCHGSIFDVKTGDVKHGPATKKEPIYEVKIDGSSILIRKPTH